MKYASVTASCLVVLFFIFGSYHGNGPGVLFGVDAAVTQQGVPKNPVDIQWFKKEMGIAPKYRQQDEGIYGMSWGHFLTMAFLVLFFFAALGVGYYRSRKTREILVSILEKEGEGK